MCAVDVVEPDYYDERTRRAARPHACDECTRTIAKGERHLVINGCWDGRPQRFRICDFCVALRELYSYRGTWSSRYEDCQVPLGDLLEHLREHRIDIFNHESFARWQAHVAEATRPWPPPATGAPTVLMGAP
jgi:hypothetical protein